MSEERFDRLENMVAELISMVGTSNKHVRSLEMQVATTNTQVMSLDVQVRSLTEQFAESLQEQREMNRRLDRVEQEVAKNTEHLKLVDAHLARVDHRLDNIETYQHSGERFQEFDKRLVNVEHGMYRVSCVERAQNKLVVHLHEVDVELSLIKDKLPPAATQQMEPEKISS